MTPAEQSGASPRPTSTSPVPLEDIAAQVSAAPPHRPGDAVETRKSVDAARGIAVTGIAQASGSVRPGDLYVALPGARTHGAKYAGDAAGRGAVALLTDPEGVSLLEASEGGARAVGAVPVLVVPEPRSVLGALASFVYGSPSSALTLVGVTGTQGKTTTTQLLAAAAAGAGRRTAVIGTMGTWIAGEPVGSVLTTPEAPDLHALFAVMRERGVDVCAMEVSSHALVMGRVDGVVFDLAVFTNFGRDHLDFHHSVEDYFAAKASLFTPGRAARALLNADDDKVMTLAQDPSVPTSTFSLTDRSATWWCHDLTSGPRGSRFVLEAPTGEAVPCSVALAGRFNVANSVAALASLGELGLPVEPAAAALERIGSVPGRMESVDAGQPFAVIVDYAHKPDAIEAALTALRQLTEGRLTIVVGAGGDRDRGKRALMGEVSARFADLVIVTDDNPRTEDPAQIRAEIVSAARGGSAEVVEIGDRRAAIEQALSRAEPGDTVLIAGKGHETGQYVQDHVLPFDDRAVAREVLAGLGKAVG